MSIFKEKLIHLIPEGKLAIADLGYRGAPDKATHRNPFDDPEVKDFKRRALARQETVNCRLKSFSILEDRFRTMGPPRPNQSRKDKHRVVFECCAVIIQYQMENGHRLFEV